MSHAEASFLQSVIALTYIILLLVVLPDGGHLLLAKLRFFTAREKDLRLAQASAVLTAVGTMAQGLAETRTVLVADIVVADMGRGYTFMITGLMTLYGRGGGLG